MSFDLKQIPGAVVEKKGYDTASGKYRFFGTNSSLFHESGWNDAIDAQSSVRLRLNREKLAKTLSNDDYWKGGILSLNKCYELADAIIANELEIIEVDNGK